MPIKSNPPSYYNLAQRWIILTLWTGTGIYTLFAPHPPSILQHINWQDYDKVTHWGLFFLSTGITMWVLEKRNAILLLLSLAIGTEAIQWLTGSRHFCIYDILANIMGILSALLFLHLVSNKMTRSLNR
jgi:uncharacterized membrane protein YjdF